MTLKDHFEERFKAISSEMDVTPWLKGAFFLIYQTPSGNYNEMLNKRRERVEEEMRLELSERVGSGTTIDYMCRRIGPAHYRDDFEPQKWTKKI